ncbi:MAG: hypothetical protein ABH835_04605 [Patescibacteria group bacterium]|nr:hypothetical protein [Patescibacteria group bacterium]
MDHNHHNLEKKAEAKHKRRQSKKTKKPKMKVSGKSVFELKKLKEK